MTYSLQHVDRNLWGTAVPEDVVSGLSARDVRIAIRLGCIEEAEAILSQFESQQGREASWLNLMGVVCEARGDWRRAKRFYGRAMRADRGFAPAQQNMRRWFELFTFGKTHWPVALGDDAADT